MSDLEPVRLSAEGLPACAQPEQIPAKGLMEEYLKLKGDPNTEVRPEQSEVGTRQSLLVDGKVKLTTAFITEQEEASELAKHGMPKEFASGEKLIIQDPETGRVDEYRNGERKTTLVLSKDPAGRLVTTDALISDTSVVSEFIWRASDTSNHPTSTLQFSKEGKVTSAYCMDENMKTTYLYHPAWESPFDRAREEWAEAAKKRLDSFLKTLKSMF